MACQHVPYLGGRLWVCTARFVVRSKPKRPKLPTESGTTQSTGGPEAEEEPPGGR